MAPPVWVTTELDPLTVGSFFCQALIATGTAPVTYAVISGSLPAGLCLDESGLLVFCPTAAGGYSFTVRATNPDGYSDRTFSSSTATAAGPGTSLSWVLAVDDQGRLVAIGPSGTRVLAVP